MDNNCIVLIVILAVFLYISWMNPVKSRAEDIKTVEILPNVKPKEIQEVTPASPSNIDKTTQSVKSSEVNEPSISTVGESLSVNLATVEIPTTVVKVSEKSDVKHDLDLYIFVDDKAKVYLNDTKLLEIENIEKKVYRIVSDNIPLGSILYIDAQSKNNLPSIMFLLNNDGNIMSSGNDTMVSSDYFNNFYEAYVLDQYKRNVPDAESKKYVDLMRSFEAEYIWSDALEVGAIKSCQIEIPL
jgi:hypothetical protein